MPNLTVSTVVDTLMQSTTEGDARDALGGLTKAVTNLAALKALTGDDLAGTVLMQGHTTAGDGGGGLFRWVAADATTANDGTVVAPTAGGGRFFRIYEAAVNVKWFGAAGDDVTDDTAAFQAALAVAIPRRCVVNVPDGIYRISSTLSIASGSGNTGLVGQSAQGAKLRNLITDKTPLIKITAETNYFTLSGLSLLGNGTTGAGGNGHAIALINEGASPLYPQQVSIVDILVRDHRGTGLSHSGGDIPACAVYNYKSTVTYIDRCTFYQNAMGVRIKEGDKHYMYGLTVDAADNAAVYLENTECIGMVSCTLNGSGSGGADDGLLVLRGCHAVSFKGGRLKNANPVLVNMYGASTINDSISITGSDLNQLDGASGVVAARIGTGNANVTIDGCRVRFASSIVAGLGIDVLQGVSGSSCSGLVIRGCTFDCGGGAGITAFVQIAPNSNRCYGARIESCTFGHGEDIPAATVIPDCILLNGRTEGVAIDSCSFISASNFAITNCIRIASSNVLDVVISNPIYAGFGTITNQVSNSAAARVTEIGQNGVKIGALGAAARISRVLSNTATWDPASVASGAATSTTLAVNGAAVGDVVEVGFSTAVPAGCLLVGAVTASDTVTVSLANLTGAPVDLASGTVRACVKQFA